MKEYACIGKRLPRIDGIVKATGDAKYTDDLTLPGMLHGKVLRSPLPFVSFLEKSLLKIPATRNITAGDFNGDGSPDLIFHTSDPEILWASFGDGKGNFTLPKKHGFGKSYSAVS